MLTTRTTAVFTAVLVNVGTDMPPCTNEMTATTAASEVYVEAATAAASTAQVCGSRLFTGPHQAMTRLASDVAAPIEARLKQILTIDTRRQSCTSSSALSRVATTSTGER